MTKRLATKVNEARRKFFVGRSEELERLRQFAAPAYKSPHQIAHILGPGGTGKTTLLQRFHEELNELGIPNLRLDARSLERTPQGLEKALSAAAGVTDLDRLLDWFDENDSCVISIDTFELLGTLERWLQSEFLPRLGENVKFVTSGRGLQDLHWIADAGWKSLSEIIQLRNLSAKDACELAARHGLEEAQQRAIASCSYGNPLALSLLLHAATQEERTIDCSAPPAEIVQHLTQRLIDTPPSESHREALQAACVLRTTNEDILRDIVGQETAGPAYDWLSNLSFFESGANGIWPHDLIRDIVVRDIQMRRPPDYDALLEKCRRAFISRLGSASPARREAILFELFFTLREIPAAKMVFNEWGGEDLRLDYATTGEFAEIVDAIRRVEGPEAAEWARMWRNKANTTVYVVRDGSGDWHGYLVDLFFEKPAEEDMLADKVFAAAWEYVETTGGLKRNETAHFARWWALRNGEQQPGPVQLRIFMKMTTENLSTPGLAFHMASFRQPEKWLPSTGPFRIKLLSERRHAGNDYGWIGFNWREESIAGWLDAVTRGILDSPYGPVNEKPIEPLYVLDKKEFRSEVKKALKNLRSGSLLESPLLQSRIVLDRCPPNAPLKVRATILSQILDDAITQQKDLDQRRYTVLKATYKEKPRKQLANASRLNMAYSTYRYYLNKAFDDLFAYLWSLETSLKPTQPDMPS